MKRYINIITGAIIDSPFVLLGENWKELIENEFSNDHNVNSDDHFDNNDNDTDDDAFEESSEDVVNLRELSKAELIEFAKKEDIEIDVTSKKAVILDTIIDFYESLK